MTKLSISKAWEETREIIARDGRLFIAVALALFVLPGLILNVVTPPAPPEQLPPAGPWIAVAAAALVVSLVGQLAVIRLAMGPHLTVRDSIVHGAKRLLPYLAAVLMWSLPFILVGAALASQMAKNPEHPSPAVALAFLALMIAVTFVAVRLMLSSPVASAEPIGPVAILQRSWAISSGSWWRLFGFLLLFGVGALALLIAVGSVVGLAAKILLGGIGPLTVGGLLVAVVSQLLSAALSIAFFVMLARIYVQLAGRGTVSVPSSGT